MLPARIQDWGNKIVKQRKWQPHFHHDEAQATYTDFLFWNSIIKDCLATTRGPRFCISTSYGSPSTGSPDYPKLTTPPILSREWKISLTIPHNHTQHALCLFYKQQEFKDVVEKWSEDTSHTIGGDVKCYIFEQTNGHPGMVGAMLRYVALAWLFFLVFKSQYKMPC